jgi:hypothetical protein
LLAVGKSTVWKEPPATLSNPELSLFWSAQNPTLIPRSLRPVTWVCTDPGKFSVA